MEPTEAVQGASSGLEITEIIDAFGYVVYAALAFLAVWGVYNSILLYRGLARKTIKGDQAAALIGKIREFCLKGGNYEAALALCQGPPYWHTALAQLIAVALRNRDKGLAKIKQVLVLEFHTEIVSGMENRLASLSTIVRMGPLLGLLGTVASMIGAFGRIGGGGGAAKVNPADLASDISLALWATGAGLLIATPIMILANDIHARLRHLRDRTERQLQDVIEVLEQAEAQSGRAGQASRSGTTRAVLPR
jgi:biopolymer transport protein ExbB